MISLRITVDRRALADATVKAAAAAAMQHAGEYLLEEANRTAPIEEGTLIRSGAVSTSRQGSNGSRAKITTTVGYDTPYAVRQHEDTRLRHDEGRRAKWLEATFKERGVEVGKRIATAIRTATR